MIVESWSIIIIVLLVSFMSLHKGKTDYCIATLPLLFVPAAHLLLIPVSRRILVLWGIPRENLRIVVLVVVMVIAVSLYYIFSKYLDTNKAKTYYLVLCVPFTVVITILYILNILKLR